MKRFTILLSTMLLYVALGYSQVAINTDGSAPDGSAILDLTSTNKGLLLPRMTTVQISGISTPAAGLLVYNTDSSDFYGYNGSKWISLCLSGDTITPFACGNPIIDSRDGQSYTTVQIGTQCWMAENLNIGTMINSETGGANDDGEQANNSTIEKYCYNNSEDSCDVYGGLYQWNEMMQYVTSEGTQGICPSGWHLPSDAEWKTMEIHLGMSQAQADANGWRGTDEGSKLAGNEPLWIDGNLDQNANFGTSGFTGLPGGYRYTNGSFISLTYYAYFWTSSENGADAWRRNMHYDHAQVVRFYIDKADGFSVRCIKN